MCWNLSWQTTLLMMCLGLLAVDSEDAFDSASEVNVHGYILHESFYSNYCWWIFSNFVIAYLMMESSTGGLLTPSTILLMLLFGWLIFMMNFLLRMYPRFNKWLRWWWSLTWMMLVSWLSFPFNLFCFCLLLII